MFRFIEEVYITISSFSGWLPSVANAPNSTTCISSNNQLCMTRPTLIDLNPDENNQGLRYYQFIVNLDRCNGICNTPDEPSSRMRIANKTEDINLNVFNIITKKNEPKTLIKDISQESKYKFDGTKWNSD